ncbi:MAG: hypothetical protein ABFD00_09960 [Chloroherpetonaceae bacterium]
MKRAFLIFFLILCSTLVTVLATNNYLKSFRASSNSADITVEWETIDESQIRNFDIERSSNNQSFQKIKTIDSKNRPSYYRYVDEEAFLKDGEDPSTQSAKIYAYRLKINLNDGTNSYSESISVTHQTSGIRRTWGMIKELFR